MNTMADSTFKLLPIALLLCLSASASATATARMLHQDSTPSSTTSLSARLKLDELQEEGSTTSNGCWESLYQLQSCTAEVVLFFLNGETYLGPGCCRAIWIIQHQCWPQMLTSLGYTPEEANILRGYCDASEAGSSPALHRHPPLHAQTEYCIVGWNTLSL
ncbi:UNVERIFIED_CONTAM: Egg cell-secreted protein 1.4 [Sesamum latifolium]|uniref:Egg cell-secreted protein 1.4 n=1 Tax=Sesamum latifolium TaxID=2727402 RepID=A0AAW2SGC5_9LAMI